MHSWNENMFDAVIFGTKRIGHGFNLALHPYLVEKVKEANISLEVCPLSNSILAYTLDLRSHPARFLMNQGVQVTMNSDDPGFYGYSGVTLDYAIALLAWQLSI